MKELSIEEKAKAYDEVREKIAIRFGSNVADEIFSQFEMSEDERIRKSLIDMLKNDEKCYLKEIAWLEKQGQTFTNKDVDDAYLKGICDAKQELEKQGEQKPTDKVEPKFKVGDFIVNDYCMGRIVEITNDAYLLDTEYGILFSCPNTRLWDITKDAKDGDVLYNKDGFSGSSVFIYKDISDKTHACLYYTRLFRDKDFCIHNDVMWENGVGVNGGEFYPATKEQRDLLFQKMKEAGYIFDFEKKELKKIVQKPADTEKGAKGNEWEIPNSVWSAEDETKIKRIIALLKSPAFCAMDGNKGIIDKNIKYLKSLKERVQSQPKQEWNKEDERICCTIVNDIAIDKTMCKYEISKGICDEQINWLKSLKDRYTWRPSDEQMTQLKRHCPDNRPLTSLYEQLKKLREE